jgi:hypothetical protein
MDSLSDIAIRFKIDPIGPKEIGVPFKVIIDVLSNLAKSYENFIRICLLKDDQYSSIFSNSPDKLKAVIDDLKLNIIDLSYSSFEAAAAPNLLQPQPLIFNDDFQDWKFGTFNQYKDDILDADYTNSKYINAITRHYSDQERREIYNPLFKAAGSSKDYKVHLLSNDTRKPYRTIIKPESRIVDMYTQVSKQPKKEIETKTVQFYAKVQGGTDELKKAQIKEFLYHEELEYDTYPFKPSIISCDDEIYKLRHELECRVWYEENMYHIAYDALDIVVWGESRKDCEEAFYFAFHALYENYAIESDDNLSKKAIQLKTDLLKLVDKKLS